MVDYKTNPGCCSLEQNSGDEVSAEQFSQDVHECDPNVLATPGLAEMGDVSHDLTKGPGGSCAQTG